MKVDPIKYIYLLRESQIKYLILKEANLYDISLEWRKSEILHSHSCRYPSSESNASSVPIVVSNSSCMHYFAADSKVSNDHHRLRVWKLELSIIRPCVPFPLRMRRTFTLPGASFPKCLFGFQDTNRVGAAHRARFLNFSGSVFGFFVCVCV